MQLQTEDPTFEQTLIDLHNKHLAGGSGEGGAGAANRQNTWELGSSNSVNKIQNNIKNKKNMNPGIKKSQLLLLIGLIIYDFVCTHYLNPTLLFLLFV